MVKPRRKRTKHTVAATRGFHFLRFGKLSDTAVIIVSMPAI